MPVTPPIPAATLDKIESRNQAVRWELILKNTRQFRAYCCNIDSDSIMGVAKEPVIIADISPRVICLGASISWDISDSYAPGSTLTDWEVDFGDGVGSASGADFPGDVTNGTYTYTDEGTYTITITIEEGLGLTQTATVEVTVIDCSTGEEFFDDLWAYISTDGFGVYYRDMAADSPEWEAINTGLEDDALYVRALAINPATRHLAHGNHELWAATMDGVYKTQNGGASWEKLSMGDPSNAEFGDAPAATEDELDWQNVVFDTANEGTVFVLATKESS